MSCLRNMSMEPNINYLSKDELEFRKRVYARWQYGGNFTVYDVNMSMEPNINYLSKDELEFRKRVYARWQYGGNFTVYDVNMIERLLLMLSKSRYELDENNLPDRCILPNCCRKGIRGNEYVIWRNGKKIVI